MRSATTRPDSHVIDKCRACGVAGYLDLLAHRRQSVPLDPSPVEQSQIGYDDAQVVIDALARFYKIHRAYPANLVALMPK